MDSSKFLDKGRWSKHSWWMTGYTEKHQTTSRVMMRDTVSVTQDGRLLPTALSNWTLRTGPFVADRLIGSLVGPQGSDLGFELIMEPNSCCYEPINKNHFYSRFFSLSWPLRCSRLSTDCALWLPAVQYPNPAVLFWAFRADDQTSLTAWISIVAIKEVHHSESFDKSHANTDSLTGTG